MKKILIAVVMVLMLTSSALANGNLSQDQKIKYVTNLQAFSNRLVEMRLEALKLYYDWYAFLYSTEGGLVTSDLENTAFNGLTKEQISAVIGVLANFETFMNGANYQNLAPVR